MAARAGSEAQWRSKWLLDPVTFPSNSLSHNVWSYRYIYIYIYILIRTESTRAQRPLFRASVGARVRRLPELVILARLSNISENDLCKIQYLSASIVKTPSRLTTSLYEV
jgi:hypothetical protein